MMVPELACEVKNCANNCVEFVLIESTQIPEFVPCTPSPRYLGEKETIILRAECVVGTNLERQI